MRGLTLKTHLSLSVKLVLGFLGVIIPAVAVLGGISFYALRDLNNANRQLYEISRSLEAVHELEVAFGRVAAHLSDMAISGGNGDDQTFNSMMHQAEARLRSCADAACHGAARRPSEMAASLVPTMQKIKERATTLMHLDEDAARAHRVHLLRDVNQLAQDANGQMERMSATLVKRIESLQGQSLRVDQRLRRLMIASMFFILVVAIATAYVVAGRLLKPIHELVVGTGHVMKGNLAYRVPIVEKDEIGDLAQSFNVMAQEIQEHREHLEKTMQAKTAELKRAQDSLLQSEKLASIGLLAAGVAHELNNPLTSILMNVNLLMEEVDDQSGLHGELQRISDDTVRCKRIIDDLRDFSRRHELEIHSCDLNEIVRKAVGLILHQAKHSAITMEPPHYGELPLISCDPGRLQQVLMNVFVNAIQAMPNGGSLTVRTGLREKFAEISIQDTGMGISSEAKTKIFDPFFTTKPDGTGLGLSIVYRIMEEHGGKVEIESLTEEEAGAAGKNSGTTVRLLVPISGMVSNAAVDENTANLIDGRARA
ncbi:MAG: ATP-binding protein [Deltaproteobacteria bacterium]